MCIVRYLEFENFKMMDHTESYYKIQIYSSFSIYLYMNQKKSTRLVQQKTTIFVIESRHHKKTLCMS